MLLGALPVVNEGVDSGMSHGNPVKCKVDMLGVGPSTNIMFHQ